MRNILAVFCLVLTTLIQAQSDEEQLTTMLHQFMAGASVNDKATHQNFWAEDLIYTSSAGKRFGKAEIMSSFNDEIKVDEPKTTYTAEEIQITIYDNVAILAFKMKGQSDESIQYYLNSGTFLKRNNQWQVVNWQATMMPKAP